MVLGIIYWPFCLWRLDLYVNVLWYPCWLPRSTVGSWYSYRFLWEFDLVSGFLKTVFVAWHVVSWLWMWYWLCCIRKVLPNRQGRKLPFAPLTFWHLFFLRWVRPCAMVFMCYGSFTIEGSFQLWRWRLLFWYGVGFHLLVYLVLLDWNAHVFTRVLVLIDWYLG